MKILGIDYGEKRIGLAISDETGTLAREFGILSPKEFWDQLTSILEKEQIGHMVVGWPLNMSGEMTDKTREVDEFIAKLKTLTKVDISKVDERLSTSFALKLPGGQTNTDSLAAQIILQNFLDSRLKI